MDETALEVGALPCFYQTVQSTYLDPIMARETRITLSTALRDDIIGFMCGFDLWLIVLARDVKGE